MHVVVSTRDRTATAVGGAAARAMRVVAVRAARPASRRREDGRGALVRTVAVVRVALVPVVLARRAAVVRPASAPPVMAYPGARHLVLIEEHAAVWGGLRLVIPLAARTIAALPALLASAPLPRPRPAAVAAADGRWHHVATPVGHVSAGRRRANVSASASLTCGPYAG